MRRRKNRATRRRKNKATRRKTEHRRNNHAPKNVRRSSSPSCSNRFLAAAAKNCKKVQYLQSKTCIHISRCLLRRFDILLHVKAILLDEPRGRPATSKGNFCIFFFFTSSSSHRHKLLLSTHLGISAHRARHMVLQPSVHTVRVEDVSAMVSHLHVLSLCHPSRQILHSPAASATTATTNRGSGGARSSWGMQYLSGGGGRGRGREDDCPLQAHLPRELHRHLAGEPCDVPGVPIFRDGWRGGACYDAKRRR